jgi:hypothetical protein
MGSPISAWVRSSAKRRCRIWRSRSEMRRISLAASRGAQGARVGGRRRCPACRRGWRGRRHGRAGRPARWPGERRRPGAPRARHPRRRGPRPRSRRRWAGGAARPPEPRRRGRPSACSVAGKADRPGVLAEVAFDFAQDGRHRIARRGRTDRSRGRVPDRRPRRGRRRPWWRAASWRDRQEALDQHLAVDRIAFVAEAREELAVFAGAIRVSEAGAGADPVCAVAFALESDGSMSGAPASIANEPRLRARRGERRRCGGHACECECECECERERVRARGWRNRPCSAGSVRVRRVYPSGRSEVPRWPASRARRARAVGDRHGRGCYVSRCWPGPTVRIGPAPSRTLVGRSQLMVTASGVACSRRSDPQ